MKTLLSLTAILLSITIYGQVPQAIKYQATARDTSGSLLLNQSISLRTSIIDSAAGGNMAYQETQVTSTNQFGTFGIEIGRGNRLVGSFQSIAWATGNKWLRIELDPLGGSNYSLMGVSEMVSVPYALYAESTANDADTDSTNELQDLASVRTGNNITLSISNGIGTTFSVAGADNDPTNECNVSMAYIGQVLYIVDACGSVSVPIPSPWLNNGSDINYNTGNVGIGTTTPTAKLQVANGDIYLDNIGSGVIIKSPNGNCWRITVDNVGSFVSNAITCP